jgi:segregation and condensation protein B
VYNPLVLGQLHDPSRDYSSNKAKLATMERSDSTQNETVSLTALLESVLFVASGPVPLQRLAKALETTPAVVQNLLGSLTEEYATRGLRLQWSGSDVQLTTAPESSDVIERFLGLELTTRLSQAALEVLAIVAYMQPITRPQIDQIRGVNSDGSLRTLLSKGLIEEVGRLETPGRPILYGSTPEFLQHFGLSAVTELPELEEVEDDDEEEEIGD